MHYFEKIAFQQAVKEELQSRYNRELQKEANIQAMKKWLISQLGGQMKPTNIENLLKILAIGGGGAGLYALGKHQGEKKNEAFIPDYLKDASFNKEASVLPWLIPLLAAGGYGLHQVSKPNGIAQKFNEAAIVPPMGY